MQSCILVTWCVACLSGTCSPALPRPSAVFTRQLSECGPVSRLPCSSPDCWHPSPPTTTSAFFNHSSPPPPFCLCWAVDVLFCSCCHGRALHFLDAAPHFFFFFFLWRQQNNKTKPRRFPMETSHVHFQTQTHRRLWRTRFTRDLCTDEPPGRRYRTTKSKNKPLFIQHWGILRGYSSIYSAEGKRVQIVNSKEMKGIKYTNYLHMSVKSTCLLHQEQTDELKNRKQHKNNP